MNILSILLFNSTFLYYITILITTYLCSLFIYLKLSKTILSDLGFNKKITLIISSLFCPVLCAYLRTLDFAYFRLLFFLIMVSIFVFIGNKKYYSLIPTAIVSIAFSYFIEYFCIFSLSFVFYLLDFKDVFFINELCVAILQFILIYIFMRIKRFKNGLLFFDNKNNFGIGLLICGPLTILFSLHKDYLSIQFKTIIVFGILISAIGLFIWIRSAFKRYYRKRLKLRAEEYSKIELAEKEKEIEKLSNENTSLSSIIHLDNHIIQSIESELKALNNTNLTDKLLTSINQRNEYVNDLLIKSKNLASTGNAEIDAVLLDLYIKSASRGIDYNLNTDCDINYLLNNIIPVSDFEALLRNLITNSIVDIENNPEIPGRISIKISQPNDIYELTVMDNGVFNDNNSISDIVEKSNASILINKFDNNDSFTKSLTIIFDGLKNNTEL